MTLGWVRREGEGNAGRGGGGALDAWVGLGAGEKGGQVGS